jgi:hypothetical protein
MMTLYQKIKTNAETRLTYIIALVHASIETITSSASISGAGNLFKIYATTSAGRKIMMAAAENLYTLLIKTALIPATTMKITLVTVLQVLDSVRILDANSSNAKNFITLLI